MKWIGFIISFKWLSLTFGSTLLFFEKRVSIRHSEAAEKKYLYRPSIFRANNFDGFLKKYFNPKYFLFLLDWAWKVQLHYLTKDKQKQKVD